MAEAGANWFDFTESLGETILGQALDAYAVDYGETILFSSARNEYMITRMKRILLRTIHTLQYQLKKGTFQPNQYEVSFSVLQDLESLNFSLSSEEKMRLKGRIDRVDTYEEESAVYVKVIDYKSSSHDFDLVALYHGLQLQLVVYLNAAMDYQRVKHPGKEIIPAAILYYHVQDPCVEVPSGMVPIEEINETILNRLRMKGVVNADREVIEKLDQSLTSKSQVIPVEYKKDGGFSSASSVLSGEHFDLVSEFVSKKITELGKEIVSGSKQINPYQQGIRTACDYCSYRSICGFDCKLQGFQFREWEDISDEDVISKLEESVKAKD